MKERLGGLLAITLGAVLIGTGIHTGDPGAVGVTSPTCGVTIGAIAPCPTGTITVNETTVAKAAAWTHAATASDPTPPAAGWKVTITSTTCVDPSTNAAVSQTLTVPNNGQAVSTSLFVYTNQASTTLCTYSLSQAAVAGFTTTYSVVSPFSIPFGGGPANSSRSVTITNSFVHTTPTSSAPASSSAAPHSSSSAAPRTSSSAAPSMASASASSSPVLAQSGPRTRIGASLYIGIALVLLGAAMVFGGQLRRTGRRT